MTPYCGDEKKRHGKISHAFYIFCNWCLVENRKGEKKMI
jgi:hypothetical protein